jgi:hypothetical protein
MRGSYKSLHPVFVRHDLNVATRAFKQRVKELSVKVPETYAAGINQCEQDIVEKLRLGQLRNGLLFYIICMRIYIYYTDICGDLMPHLEDVLRCRKQMPPLLHLSFMRGSRRKQNIMQNLSVRSTSPIFSSIH